MAENCKFVGSLDYKEVVVEDIQLTPVVSVDHTCMAVAVVVVMVDQ